MSFFIPIAGTRVPLFKTICVAITLSSILLAASSCTKDADDSPVKIVDSLLVVNFEAASVQYGLVDSGFVLLKKNGSGISSFLRFTRLNGELAANIDGFRHGDYRVELYVYSRASGSDGPREYFRSTQMTLGENRGRISVDAPDGNLNDEWEPRLILSYNNIRFFIPVDQSASYFRVEAADMSAWKSMTLKKFANERIPGTGSMIVASHQWSCKTNCFNNSNMLEDSISFRPMREKLAGKTWNFGEFELRLEKKNGELIEDYIRYDP